MFIISPYKLQHYENKAPNNFPIFQYSFSVPPLSISIIIDKLETLYRPPRTFLKFETPLDLLIATVLSAQCTDDRVNIVTQTLFKKYRHPEDYLKVPIEELERDIHSCGTFRVKAKYIRGIARMTKEEFGGKIPDTMEELIRFPGVGRKTAAIILYAIFGKNEGIAVDTHVERLALRMGLTKAKTVPKIEFDLMKKTSREQWGRLNTLLISHGRAVCTARNRKCELCAFKEDCPSSSVHEREDLAK